MSLQQKGKSLVDVYIIQSLERWILEMEVLRVRKTALVVDEQQSTILGVSSVSRLFFFLRKSLIFFFGVSRVWKKKTEKCMIRDLRFFCDATYTKKKLRDLRFF